MSNLYTDEQQEQRYAHLRDKKKKTETMFAVFWILTALCDALCLMMAMNFTVGTGQYLVILFDIVLAVLQFLGLYLRIGRFTLSSFLPMAAGYICGLSAASHNGTLNFALSIIPIAAVTGWGLWLQKQWAFLKEQEGFPTFKIDRNQTQQRAKNAERITKLASIAEGARTEASPNAGEMKDLLDTGAQAAASELSGYHDRSRHVSGVQTAKQYTSGDMDEI